MTSNDEVPKDSTPDQSPPFWTYPTRLCRFCREDVPPTVTLYPPGLPLRFQRPIVEYKNEDEYGRLIKPCMCRGTSRYIHDLCMQRLRTQHRQAGSLWKCQDCGHKFSFQKLTVQKFLSSKIAASVLTVFVMVIIIFMLGFIANPILNLYVDPYDTYMGRDSIWDELEVRAPIRGVTLEWGQHFLKGTLSVGVLGFLKTFLMHPLQWLNFRNTILPGSRMTTTGRDRAANISWIVVLVGICSSFYFLYQWVQVWIQMSLRRVGNHIVDTQLPGDDDDLKPPPGWKYEPPVSEKAETPEEDVTKPTASNYSTPMATPSGSGSESDYESQSREFKEKASVAKEANIEQPSLEHDVGRSTGIDSSLSQSWSFANI